jgi:hypothetical protein
MNVRHLHIPRSRTEKSSSIGGPICKKINGMMYTLLQTYARTCVKLSSEDAVGLKDFFLKFEKSDRKNVEYSSGREPKLRSNYFLDISS